MSGNANAAAAVAQNAAKNAQNAANVAVAAANAAQNAVEEQSWWQGEYPGGYSLYGIFLIILVVLAAIVLGRMYLFGEAYAAKAAGLTGQTTGKGEDVDFYN